MKNFIILLAAIVLLSSGCSSLKAKTVQRKPLEERTASFPPQERKLTAQEKEIFTLSPIEQDAFVVVGFNSLEDKRHKSDVSYMTSIKEKVSSEVLKVLQDTQLFDEIHVPALDSDNIVFGGEIRKFNWESFDTIISYIPGLNVLPFLGVPSTRSHSEVEIYLELKNAQTNEIILNLNESYVMNKKYTMYNFKPEKANQELAYCFDIVINKIKENIFLRRNKILEAIKSAPPQTGPSQNFEPRREEKHADNLDAAGSASAISEGQDLKKD